MSFVSSSALLAGRFIIRSSYFAWLFWIKAGIVAKADQWKPNNGQVTIPKLVAFHRPFRRVFKSAISVSSGLCLLYAHCWSKSRSAFKVSQDEGASMMCRGVFRPLILLFGRSPIFSSTDDKYDCQMNQSCADEGFIWLLWAVAILGHLFYFSMHEFGGKHHKGYRPSLREKHANTKRYNAEVEISLSSSSLDKECVEDLDEDDHHDDVTHHYEANHWSLSSTLQQLTRAKAEQPKDTLSMCPWFHVMLIKSGFDILVSLHIFLGRFDARKMQVALLESKDANAVFDFSNCLHQNHDNAANDDEDNGFWFDFMSDCGDGFNSSYQVSRCLAQPFLGVTAFSTAAPKRKVRQLPRGKLLVIGGDLAYPDPTPETYERRFFRTFEDAMPPPPSFRKEHISIHKPALPVKGWVIDQVTYNGEEEKKSSDDCKTNDTAEGTTTTSNQISSYEGPIAFAIPGNHDWFDGLATYTRYILSRDWLGGWIMPQQTSYFALKLPCGWWLLGFDLALDNDINIEQFAFFAELSETAMQPDDNVIIVTHIPFWVLSDYENHSDDALPETNLRELMRTHLRGRVRLRLAGDLHHYTRHTACDDGRNTSTNNTNSRDSPVLIVSGGGGAVSVSFPLSWLISHFPTDF